MSNLDFAIINIMTGENSISIDCLYNHDFKKFLQKLGAIWIQNKKIWLITPNDIGKTTDEIIEVIKNYIRTQIPAGWEQNLERLGQFTTVTEKFEIKIGLAGIRFKVPLDHKIELLIRKITHIKQDGNKWLLEANHVLNDNVKILLKEISLADRKLFLDSFLWTEKRKIHGYLFIKLGQENLYGLEEKSIMFGDQSFMRVIEPRNDGFPCSEFPFFVDKIKNHGGGDYELDIMYLPLVKSYNLLQNRIYHEQKFPKSLDLSNVNKKWGIRIADDPFA